ncbi:hypothetical protein BTJ39_16670 [Izhakiella australiensis]|uniref:Dynamin N-terminal domain-containing protein n=1 Tax=Izhakiella australiensis TaxID=1926881 RepID=A0A1S8YIG4_9GAMM|nr:dynamin family protein [Izhakiella australiensis]OON38725.1 hypothetical protein BTJ39_16670 [Izhakiella australiensis]
MFERKKALIQYLEAQGALWQEAVNAAPSLLQDLDKDWQTHKQQLAEQLVRSELLIPVTGGFSAGKSSALNALFERDILPVAVSAETAIPAELRYGKQEGLLAVRTDGTEEHHSLAALAELSRQAHQYEVVRLTLDHPLLLAIQPFVLVDMPGFDSAQDAHARAILRYLSRGAFYFWFVNCKDGMLKQQDLQRLEEFRGLDRQFAVFISRCDLCPPQTISEVTSYISDQLATAFGDAIKVATLNENDVSALTDFFSQVNPRELFDQLYLPPVKEFYLRSSMHINTAILALKSSVQQGQQQIADLKKALANIIDQQQRSLSGVDAPSITSTSKRIAGRVRQRLEMEIDELTRQAIVGREPLNRSITAIVRSNILIELKKVTDSRAKKVVETYSDSGLASLNTQFILQEDWLHNLVGQMQQQLINLILGNSSHDASTTATASIGNAGAVFRSGTDVLNRKIQHPVINVVLTVLTRLVNTLFDKYSARLQQEQTRRAMSEDLIPAVVQQVEEMVAEALLTIEKQLNQAVAQAFSARISEQKEIVEKAQQTVLSERQQQDQTLANLERCRAALNQLTESTLMR